MLKKVNNLLVKPHKPVTSASQKAKAHQIFGDVVYPNCYFIAKKRSGKTCLLENILFEAIDKNTDIHIYCNTVHKDEAYINMIDRLRKNGNEVDVNTSMFEDQKNGKRTKRVNKLGLLVDKLIADAEENEDKKGKKGKKGKGKKKKVEIDNSKVNPESSTIKDISPSSLTHLLFPNMFGGGDYKKPEEKKEKKKVVKQKGGTIAPERVFILDDLGHELRQGKTVERLLKNMRHIHCNVMLSTQHLQDISPGSRGQCDILYLFKGFSEPKLIEIRQMIDSRLEDDEFIRIYREATKEPYSFLMCNVRDGTYRKNLNEEFDI